MKIIYVNCGVKNYTKVDHRSYRQNSCSCKKRTEKNIFPYKPEFVFFRLSFCNCISCVYNCDDVLSYNIIVLFSPNIEWGRYGCTYVQQK